MPNNPRVIRRPEVIYPGKDIDPGIVPSSDRHVYERMRDIEEEKAEIGDIVLTDPIEDEDILVWDSGVLPDGAWVNRKYLNSTFAVGGTNLGGQLSVNATTAVPALVVKGFAGQSIQEWRNSSGTTTLKTTDMAISSPLTELKLEQTGDVFGTTSIMLRNRNDENGPIFSNATLDVVDFMCRPSSGVANQRNLRLEARGTWCHLVAPELQLGRPTRTGASTPPTGGPGLCVADSGVVVRATAAGNTALYLYANVAQTAPVVRGDGWSSTPQRRAMFELWQQWATITDASRKARVVWTIYDTAAREVMRLEASGTASMIGFLGASAVARQGNTTDLKDVVVNFGFLTDGGATPLNLDGGAITGGVATFNPRDAVTNAVTQTLTIGHNTTGTAAAGFGSRVLWCLESSTTEDRDAAKLDTTWVVATDGSRTGRQQWHASDAGGDREYLRGEASGSAPMIGFLGAAAVARPAAYTQTYATADRTLAAYTPDVENAAYTGAADGEAQLADLNALRVAYENLRAFTEDVAQMLNALIDDQQAYGLAA